MGFFVWGRDRVSPRLHWLSAVMVWLGSWISGFFIIATDAWMQHPVGYKQLPNGDFQLESLSAVLLNSWTLWQYLHNMIGAVVTAAFVMGGIGAYYLLANQWQEHARVFVRMGVVTGFITSVLMPF